MSISNRYNGPTIVIVGPTGSGKTGAAIKIAKELNGEVISADSRAIYKYMDIGTAKPTLEEMDGVPHFGIDLVEPGERFTVADFKAYAEQKIQEIRARGHVPIVAGGTGLYIDALVYDYNFGKNLNTPKKGHEQKIYSKITGVDADFAAKYPDRVEISPNYIIYGIKWEPEELRARLKQRLEQMFCDGLYKETEFLVEKYGWDSQAMKSNIYQFAWEYMQKNISLDEAKQQFFYDDWHLARRQITWFKRNEHIIWLRLDNFIEKVVQNFHNS